MTDMENSSDEAVEAVARLLNLGEWWDCEGSEASKAMYREKAAVIVAKVEPLITARLHDLENNSDEAKLPLTGHDRVVIDKLADVLHAEAGWQGEEGPLQEDPRGNHFEVRLTSGHVAKVTVVLDRIEGDGRG